MDAALLLCSSKLLKVRPKSNEIAVFVGRMTNVTKKMVVKFSLG